MICPQTGKKCTRMACYEGRTQHCVPTQPTPEPTLTEIERLVDEFESAVWGKMYYPDSDLFTADYAKAKQQLIAFVETISSKAV